VSVRKYLTDLRTLPADAMRAWRAGGWPAVREEARRRTLDRIGGYARRFVIESDLSGLVEVGPPQGVDIRIFTGNDWSLLGDMGRQRLTPLFTDAAEAGRICLVAWQRREAIGYAWFSERIESRHESYDLPLPEDAIYVWQIQVSRRERRRGVASALLSTGLRLGQERGFRRSWIILHPNNVASLCAVARVAPSRVLGTLRRWKVLAWMRSRYRALTTPVPIIIPAPR
jgi:ribosomal protein S18 acetylase RimI-like enzyme